MKNEYLIRSATKNDMSDLLRMHNALMSHIYQCNPYIWKLSKVRTRQQDIFYEKIIDNPSGQVLIAEKKSNNLIIGMICGWAVTDTIFSHQAFGRIEDLWIDLKYRRNGIGNEILRHLVTFFDSLKLIELSVNYAYGNKEAELFWSKTGFNKAIVMSNAITSKIKKTTTQPPN